jgi:transposase-like protein
VFRWRHFAGEIILWAVRWYCRYGISYRELEEMMGERGVAVDHTTVYRWTQRYASRLEKGIRWYQGYISGGGDAGRVDGGLARATPVNFNELAF